MEKLRQLYNRKGLITCEVYQISKTLKQRLYNIETERSLEIFIKNTTQNKWGLINEHIEFTYSDGEVILLPVQNN